MKNSSKMLFFIMIMFGTFLIISSSSWMNAWMGLELNLISFISYMLNNKKSNSVESSVIYFLIQTMASILFLFSIIMHLKFLMMPFHFFITYQTLMMLALLTKIGASPLHFWLPMIMQKMTWMNNYILMTWQKLGPLILILSNWNQNFITLFIICSMVVGALGGFNQTSLKKMMAFSSINQISWLLISMFLSKFLWTVYFFFYFFIMLNILLVFNLFNILFIPQLMNLKMSNWNSLFIFFNVMSMGGLPPFLGFFPKMMIIMNLNNNMLMLLLIMFTLITLFYYLRIMYFILFMNNLKKNMTNNNFMNWLMKISFLTNTLMMIFILI